MDPTSSCADSSALLLDLDVATFLQGYQLVNVIITSTFFGIATCLAIASVYILITRVFFGAVLRATIVIMYFMEAITNSGVKTYLDVVGLYNPLIERMGCVETWTLVVNIIVGDAVVWWRVYMLWVGVKARRVMLGVSVMLLAATFAISVIDTCGACKLNLSLTKSMPGSGALFGGTTFGVVASSMSLVTNVVATSFTAYRAWVHIRSRKHFSQMLTLTSAEQILILVTESGFAYSAIWVLVVVFQGGEDNHDIFNATNLNLNGGPSFWDIVGQFSKGALVPVIAIYPMFIILTVALKRTCQTNGMHMFLTQIRFESQPASPCLPTAQRERLNSSTREHVLSSSSVIEAGTSNSDLSMEELGKDAGRDVLVSENYTV